MNEIKGISTTYVLTSKVLGEGTYGTVLLASNKADPSQKFDVKYFPRNREIDDKGRQDITREIEGMSVCNHKNVLKLHDIVKVEKGNNHGFRTYYIMELCKSTLKDIIDSIDYSKVLKNGIFQEKHKKTCFKYSFELIEAFKEISINKLVHRDIKPANLLIDDEGTLKVGDFGFSRILEKCDIPQLMTRDKMTVFYASLECLLETERSEKCDVFSCGVVIFHLFFGRHPYWDKSVNELGRSKLLDALKNGK